MKWLVHGFNLYALIVLGGFAFFAVGLGTAAARYRSWVKHNGPQHR
ncbi:MAG TPA: hypothetical protein VFB13_09525 [Reyranella sp.]|jgi:hypothetical protein|nr:hypothetical protein [Reyranella sp.]